MILAHLTSPDVENLDRDSVVLIPTGSLEQHGEHLPLGTDSILVTAVAEATERKVSEICLMTPCLWLGASGHHLPFPGTCSNTFEGYIQSLQSVVLSLNRYGFYRFFVVNGHGGNTDLNSLALRDLKEVHPELFVTHSGYFEFCRDLCRDVLQGPLKEIKHACEAETSLMLHVRPELVRKDKTTIDGLVAQPAITGLVAGFDEITAKGSFGYSKLGSAETGKVLFEAAVEGVAEQIRRMYEGITFAALADNG
jgi:creatinine amidohydrolase